ncbi:PD-(D/E)XK motif protein [Nesterenkonia jeotgali]|uniref:PD-(D/E)XK motif protein n=1 Tax=Nesterenkonia jeotgali TaxID=317018 RepID=UPI0022B64841|nr:PD-(D/E)XK motif protein [Nesterenkonia jeotgali]
MNDFETPPLDWFVVQAEELRSKSAGVGKRVHAEFLDLRFQNFGSNRVGLRIALDTRPRIATTLQLVRCDVRRVSDGWVLDVVEREKGASEQAAPFFRDLARRLGRANQETALVHVESTLGAWRTAFAARRDLLSDEEMIGLFGELEVLGVILDRGLAGSEPIPSWTGPGGSDHDFTLPGLYQIECKATAPHSEKLHISNEDQLESKDMSLYLACVRAAIVQDARSGTTLPEVVHQIESKLRDDGSVQLFHQKLDAVHFDRLDRRYEDVAIELTSIDYYEVRDGAPRIVPGDLHAGVSRVKYQIRTNDLAPYKVPELPHASISKRM